MSTTTNQMPDSPPAYSRQPEASSSHLTVPQIPDAERLSMEDEERPLPDGWIRQWDPTQKHHFYVDTKADPPRSIWVHPYEDPDWLAANQSKPNVKTSGGKYQPPPGPPTPTSPTSPTSPSFSKAEDGKSKPAQERGFFGKLKDKTIGTKEEREAAHKAKEADREKRRQAEAELHRRYLERRRMLEQQRMAQAQMYQSAPFAGYGYGRPTYAPPMQPYGRQRRGGGAALPLLGGLAGGLLLGDIISDGFDGGGDFGGGDFGGDF